MSFWDPIIKTDVGASESTKTDNVSSSPISTKSTPKASFWGASKPAPVAQDTTQDTSVPSPYYYNKFPSGATIGKSDTLDTSGKPLFAYRNPTDTATTTDKTRVATTFDPTKPKPLTKEEYYNPRTEGLRNEFNLKYGIKPSEQLDHAIALTVGGSNQPENLRAIPTEENQAAGQFELQLAQDLKDGKISYLDAQIADAKDKGLPPPWTPPDVKKNDPNVWNKIKSYLGGIFGGSSAPKTTTPPEAPQSIWNGIDTKSYPSPEGPTKPTYTIGQNTSTAIAQTTPNGAPVPPKPVAPEVVPPGYEMRPETFWETASRQNADIGSAKPSEGFTKFFEQNAPPIVKSIVNDLKEGFMGRGQEVDFAGNLTESKGLLNDNLSILKSDFAKVNDRYNELVKSGTTPERATQIATTYANNRTMDPLAKYQSDDAKNKTIAELKLTPDEQSALNKVAFWETLNKGLDALNFTGVGSLEGKSLEAISKIIAKETFEQPITKILMKEIPNITPETAAKASTLLSRVHDPVMVEKIIQEIDSKINGFKTKTAPVETIGDGKVVTGNDVATQAKKIGSDQGGISDWLAGQIAKENYQLKTVNISDVIKNDPDLADYLKTSNNKVRPFNTTGESMPPIVGSDGSVHDGYNRIAQAIKDKKTSITIYQGEKGTTKTTTPVYEGEKDITTKVLTRLEGKSSVSKQYISDLTNVADLKQTERDIIRNVLDTYPVGASVPIKEFADKVKAELLPLDVLNSNETGPGGRYESTALPSTERGPVANYNERIYQSPVKTHAGATHFGDNGGMGFEDEGGAPDRYFGHTRIEDMAPDTHESANPITGKRSGSVRRIIEVQSDLYQKDRLEGEVKPYEELDKNLTTKEKDLMTSLANKPGVTLQSFYRNLPYDIFSPDKTRVGLSDTQLYEHAKAGFPHKPTLKLRQYSNPTAHFRMVREEIKQAAIDGKTKLQFPTGETAMKIEGLGQQSEWYDRPDGEDIEYGDLLPSDALYPEDVKVGMTIANEANGVWVVTDVLGDGKFKAVSKSQIERYIDSKNSHLPDSHQVTFEKVVSDHTLLGRQFGSLNETFDISGKVDTNNPIYKFYEKDLGRYLKNTYDAKLVTDAQDVKWYEVEIKPEQAKQPVQAFKKGAPKFGFTRPVEEVRTAVYKALEAGGFADSKKAVQLIFSKDYLPHFADALYQRAINPRMAPIIKIYEEKGKANVLAGIHEAGHAILDPKNGLITVADKKALLDQAKKDLKLFERMKYTMNGYKGEQLFEEKLVDEWAKQQASKQGFHGPWKNLLEMFNSFVKRIADSIKKVTKAIDDYLPKKGRQGGFARVPEFKKKGVVEGNPQETLKNAEARFGVKPVEKVTHYKGNIEEARALNKRYEEAFNKYIENPVKDTAEEISKLAKEADISPEQALSIINETAKGDGVQKPLVETFKSIGDKHEFRVPKDTPPEKNYQNEYNILDSIMKGRVTNKYERLHIAVLPKEFSEAGNRANLHITYNVVEKVITDHGSFPKMEFIKTAYEPDGIVKFPMDEDGIERLNIIKKIGDEVLLIGAVRVNGYNVTTFFDVASKEKQIQKYLRDLKNQEGKIVYHSGGALPRYLDIFNDPKIKEVMSNPQMAPKDQEVIPNASTLPKPVLPVKSVLTPIERTALVKDISDLKAEIRGATPKDRTIIIKKVEAIKNKIHRSDLINFKIAEKKNSIPTGTRTQTSSLEPKQSNPLAYGDKPILPESDNTFTILTQDKADRLATEQGLKDLKRFEAQQNLAESLKIKLPQSLQDKATELAIRKEAIDMNPMRNLMKFMARRGEFKGRLPEVTGEVGKGTFARVGDRYISEATGINDAEEARNAFDKYIDTRKKFEKDMAQFANDKKSFLGESRAKRDKILEDQKVGRMHERTDRHISELLGDEATRKARIERVKAKELEAQANLKKLQEDQARYSKQVEAAHLTEAQKKSFIAKFKSILSPIEQTDATTKRIYLDWETSKIKAKEAGNVEYDKYKNQPNDDFQEVMEYEAGKKTPWVYEAFEDLYTDARRAGVDIQHKENYIPHVYNEKPEQIKKAVEKYMLDKNVPKEQVEVFDKTDKVPEAMALKIKTHPFFEKIRTFTNYKTAMEYGLTPRFQTPSEHIAYYKEELGKIVANRKLIDDLIKNGKVLDAFDAPESWIEVKLPGKLRRTYYANKNLADALNGQFRDEDNLTFGQEVMKRVSNAAKLMQEIKLSAGLPATNINFFSIGQAIKSLTVGLGEFTKGNIKGGMTSMRAAQSFIRANFNDQSIKWLKSNKKYIDMMADQNISMMNRIDDFSKNHMTWRNILTAKNFRQAKQSIGQYITGLKEAPNLKEFGKSLVSITDTRAFGMAKDIFR
jgi:hypothetical protein